MQHSKPPEPSDGFERTCAGAAVIALRPVAAHVVTAYLAERFGTRRIPMVTDRGKRRWFGRAEERLTWRSPASSM